GCSTPHPGSRNAGGLKSWEVLEPRVPDDMAGGLAAGSPETRPTPIVRAFSVITPTQPPSPQPLGRGRPAGTTAPACPLRAGAGRPLLPPGEGARRADEGSEPGVEEPLTPTLSPLRGARASAGGLRAALAARRGRTPSPSPHRGEGAC